eukprot:112200_1
MNKQWKKSGNIPEKLACSSITTLNDREIICASEYGNDIYKFHMDQVEYKWEEWIKTPTQYANRHHKLGLCNDKMYWYGNNTMFIFHLPSKRWKEFKLPNDVIQHHIFSVNNSIHCIGGDEFALHRIWDDKKEQFKINHNFHEYKYIRDPYCIYIAKKGVVLLIGGQTDWRKREVVGCIWEYCLKNGKWSKLPIPFNLYCVSAIVDKSSVIIAGGVHPSGNDSNAIYILDISGNGKYTLKKSGIVCPKAGRNHLVKTGRNEDELLVFGYINRLFKTDVFKDLQNPSLSVIKMMKAFYSQVMIHWISTAERYGAFNDTDEDGSSGRYEHYMIPLKDIITN